MCQTLKYFTYVMPTTGGGRDYYIHFRDEEMKALSDLRVKRLAKSHTAGKQS